MTAPTRRARIYRRRPGMWIVIDRDYATYSARTWRAAMDLVSPPAPRYCSKGICADLEGHEGKCST